MLRSMTGYGQASRTVLGYKLQIDVRSVNHRYCEIVIRMPREWLQFEDDLRKQAQRSLKRGRLEVFVSVEREQQSEQHLAVNWPLVESYAAAAEEIRQRLSLPEEERLQLRDLLTMPDVLTPGDTLSNTELLQTELQACLAEALEQLIAMRETEGRNLQDELTARIHKAAKLRDALQAEAPKAVEQMRARLKQRIAELLEDSTAFDEQRFVMEVAVLADRADIDEELARLSSHCMQFTTLIASDEPVGRKMDFLIQEMNREANTIGSKSNDAAITNLVVDLKAELEKLREQVQNIE